LEPGAWLAIYAMMDYLYQALDTVSDRNTSFKIGKLADHFLPVPFS
jgi:hypothetical protein